MTTGPEALIISATEITKSYPDGDSRRQVLTDVHLAVAAGEVVGLLGPSGCGKSTLLSITTGLVRPDRGEVTLAGNRLNFADPRMVARRRREHVGIMSQDYGLLERESIFDNVALPLMYGRDRPDRRVRQELVDRACHSAAIGLDQRRRVSTLSGGERQRVALARALVRSPRVLVADEPTAALDLHTAQAVVERLRTVADGGAAVLLATHDPAVAEICDQLYRLDGAGHAQRER